MDIPRSSSRSPRVALVYPGDRDARNNAAPENSRFLKVFQALEQVGLSAEPAVYHDDFCDEVRRQLLNVDAVLVWVNPIEGGRDRRPLRARTRSIQIAAMRGRRARPTPCAQWPNQPPSPRFAAPCRYG